MRRLHTSISILILMFIVTRPVFAETISKPHTFAGGTRALASQVNANFDTVYDRVNQLNRIVVKNNGQEIGTLVDLGVGISFITSKGYYGRVRLDTTTGNFGLSSAMMTHFENADCTGQASITSSYTNVVTPGPGGSVYYIPVGTEPTSVTYNSSWYTPSDFPGCSLIGGTRYAYELSPNVEAITGVPNSGYSGPFTISIE
jgi:hypothetical protein